jgi:hypothetical protein
MRLTGILICALAAGALAATAGPAAAAKKRHVYRAQSGGQIACTVAGCHRIPPQRHPQMGYTPWGTPTGFDIVVCRR